MYINKIKTTFTNDFWVFNIRAGLWQPVYANAGTKPGPTEWGTMIAL